jgi:hypothetical protein
MVIRWSLVQRPLALLAAVVAIGAVATAWASVVRTLRDAQPVSIPGRPTAIVWNDRVFQSPTELRRWLRSRGATYDAWRRTHPGGRAVLEGLPQPHRITKASDSTRRAHTGATATVSRVPAAPAHPMVKPAASASPHLLEKMFVLVSLLLGTLCLLGAAIPLAARGRLPRLSATAARHRQFLFSAAAAIFVGLIVGFTQN